MDDIAGAFYSHFDSSEIDISYDKDDNMYYGYFKSATDKNKCFKVEVNYPTYMVINGIKFENEVNCLIPGSTILNKLIDVAKELGLEYIRLYDASRIYRPGITTAFNVSLNSYPLYVLYILLHGKSWYNSRGFFSNSYKEEVEFNENMRHMAFDAISFDESNVVKNIKKLGEKFSIDKAKLRKELEDAGLEMNENTTLYDIAVFLRSLDDVFDITVHFVDFIINYKLIHYNPFLDLQLTYPERVSKKSTTMSKRKRTTRYSSKKRTKLGGKTRKFRNY